MSIQLQGPSLLLNSFAFTDVFGGCGMFMDTTWNCPKSTTVKDLVNWIGVASSQSSNGRLANVVMNFHGAPGAVAIGKSGSKDVWIDNNNAGSFYALHERKVGTIWFKSCELASGDGGRKLCRQIALAAKCRVVAGEKIQLYWPAPLNIMFMPKNMIDDYEGQVYMWNPDGTMGKFDPNGGNWN